MIPCSGTLRILYCRHYGSQPRNLFQDGVRTSCRAVDGGMKSAKFMRRIIRICHAPLTTKAPEKFERLVASPRSSSKRQSLVKLPIWCTSQVWKLKRCIFEWESLKTHLLTLSRGEMLAQNKKACWFSFFFMGGPSSTLLLASAATLCWKRNCWQQVFLMTFLWPYQLHAMGAKCTWKSDQLSMENYRMWMPPKFEKKLLPERRDVFALLSIWSLLRESPDTPLTFTLAPRLEPTPSNMTGARGLRSSKWGDKKVQENGRILGCHQ